MEICKRCVNSSYIINIKMGWIGIEPNASLSLALSFKLLCCFLVNFVMFLFPWWCVSVFLAVRSCAWWCGEGFIGLFACIEYMIVSIAVMNTKRWWRKYKGRKKCIRRRRRQRGEQGGRSQRKRKEKPKIPMSTLRCVLAALTMHALEYTYAVL